MLIDYITINNYEYRYYNPIGCNGYKLYNKQVKRVKEKIRASENGCYKDKVTRKGKLLYQDYPALLVFLEGLVEK